MMNNDPSAVASRLARAFGDIHRAQILLYLAQSPRYPSELAQLLGASRSNISNHLACLKGCGLVTAEYEGRRTKYSLISDALTQAMNMLIAIPEFHESCHCDICKKEVVEHD